jgi:hypothetical protein
MRPDDRLDFSEHSELERELAAAGDRARRDLAARPDPAFAASLRDQLVSTPARRTWWSQRTFRAAPLALGAVLMVAAVVGARELLVAVADQPSPTPAPSQAASDSADATPSVTDPFVFPDPTATPTVATSPAPTAVPTPEPTAPPTPEPDPTPEPIGSMTLEAIGCPGGVVLEWSAWESEDFNHYTTLRNGSSSIPPAYPPQGGAVDPGGTYTTEPGKTSAVDGEVSPEQTYYYRAMAFDASDRVIAASSVVAAVPGAMKSLGELAVGPVAEGQTKFRWTPFVSSGACFSFYKIVYSEEDPTPSYLEGAPHLAAVESQGADRFILSAESDLKPGHTYHFRVQALRFAHLGLFVVAQSSVATYTKP